MEKEGEDTNISVDLNNDVENLENNEQLNKEFEQKNTTPSLSSSTENINIQNQKQLDESTSETYHDCSSSTLTESNSSSEIDSTDNSKSDIEIEIKNTNNCHDNDLNQIKSNIRLINSNLLSKFIEIEKRFNYNVDTTISTSLQTIHDKQNKNDNKTLEKNQNLNKNSFEINNSDQSLLKDNQKNNNEKSSKEFDNIEKLINEMKSNTTLLDFKFDNMKDRFNVVDNNKPKDNIDIDDKNNVYRESTSNIEQTNLNSDCSNKEDKCDDKNLNLSENKMNNLLEMNTENKNKQKQQDQLKYGTQDTIYTPDEFFNLMGSERQKRLNHPYEDLLNFEPPPPSSSQQSSQPKPSTSKNINSPPLSGFPMSLLKQPPQQQQLPKTIHQVPNQNFSQQQSNNTGQQQNTFSYKNTQDFIKAVMANNSQQTTSTFSTKNAKIFEDFYKNKLKSVSPVIINSQSSMSQQSQLQSQKQRNNSTSSSSSPFKTAIEALPKVFGSNSSISSSSTNKTFNQQKQQQQHQNQHQQGYSSSSSTTSSSYQQKKSSFSNNEQNLKNRDIKIKINKVKEKFAKMAMKNCTIESNQNQQFQDLPNLINQNHKVLPKQQQQHPQQQGNKINRSVSVGEEQKVNNQIQSFSFQRQKRCISRSISESDGSVISIVNSNYRGSNLELQKIAANDSCGSSGRNSNRRIQQQQQQQQKQERYHSENMKSAESIDSLNTTLGTPSKRNKRKRGKRGGDGGSIVQNKENDENDTILIQKTNYPHLNAETLLILDLLSTPSELRETYLLEIAKNRKILIENSELSSTSLSPLSYELHPDLQKYRNQILKLNTKCSYINDEERKRLRIVIDKITSKIKNNTLTFTTPQQQKQLQQQTKKDIKILRYFEDFVNEVVLDGLPDDKKNEFKFIPPENIKHERNSNYYKTHEYTKCLEEYAKKCVNAGLGVITEGEIRINAKNNEQAFVKHTDGDVMFTSQIIRKCALQGDIVRAFVRNRPQPPPSQSQKIQSATTNSSNNQQKNNTNPDIFNATTTTSTTDLDCIISSPQTSPTSPTTTEEVIGLTALVADIDENIEGDDDDELIPKILPAKSCKGFVIQTLREVHNRKCVGSFLSSRKNNDYMAFIPRDIKLPVIRIFKDNWPETFNNGKLENVSDTLYAAKIIDWKGEMCIGTILHPIGKCHELDSENKAILYQNNLKIETYDEKFIKMFYGPLIITDDEIKKRRDIRKECVFTIDPFTARDLDDALSCKELSDGNYEIGVHISDVSYFLDENTELDDIVSQRTTSVYMVNEVFHMLPKTLCYKCSLLPGEDKLAFSIFWIITTNGEVIDYYITRTIINSCTQFAYEHAQQIIDNPDRKFTQNDNFPQIHNNFTINDIVKRIKIMNMIATKLRKKRFNNGALKINRPKISFELNPENGEPIDYYVQELKTANYMIEEFMLLANQYTAKYIYEHYPNISILRNHEPPLKNVIRTLKERLSKLNLQFDISSSKSIHESMLNLIKTSKYPDAMEICLAHLVSKPMTRARYFCSEKASTKDDFWHYALSIPMYTHFTSPIRRYPDILVHRVLSAALGYSPPPKRSPEDLHFIAAVCNEMKYNAKIAGEDSSNLYFKHYIKSKKSVLFRAAILEIFIHSMDVILIETGHIIRIVFPRDGRKKSYNVTVDTSKIPYTAILNFIIDNKNEKNKNKDNKNSDNKDNEKLNATSYPPIELKMFSEISINVHVDENRKLKGSIAIPSELQSKQQNNNKNENIENNEKNEKQIDENLKKSADDTNKTNENILEAKIE